MILWDRPGRNPLDGRGWRFSDAQVQFRNSVWIDLSRI